LKFPLKLKKNFKNICAIVLSRKAFILAATQMVSRDVIPHFSCYCISFPYTKCRLPKSIII